MMSDPELSLMKTIAESDLKSISAELGEVALDGILSEGLLKEIPIISTITSLIKSGSAINNHLYIKKILRFLQSLEDISQQERQKYINKLGRDDKEKAMAGENLLLLIERLDNVEKPKILGSIFKDYISEKLTRRDFLLLARALENFNMGMIDELRNYYLNNNTLKVSDEFLQAFYMSGLVMIKFSTGGITGRGITGGGDGFIKNDLGRLFINYL